MKTKLRLLAVFHLLSATCLSASAQGTAFTYQGRLNDGANPAVGIYDLRFAIYDSLSAGTQQGSLITNTATAVSNGLFTVTLDFGNQFPGANRWLEIAVRTNGGGGFFTLSPRQPLTPAPYAITAGNVVSGGIAGTYGSTVTFSNVNNSFSGAFNGNGANVTNVNAAKLGGLPVSSFWQTSGNGGTVPGANVLGTTDNQPLELWVDGSRALKIIPTTNTANLIGGSTLNVFDSGVVGAAIAGGGTANYLGQPRINYARGSFAAIGGGAGNVASNLFSTVAGGFLNTANGQNATVGGGNHNTASGFLTAVAGGFLNTATGDYSAVGGGYDNNASGVGAFVGGGGFDGSSFLGNTASGDAATIGGGNANSAAGASATVGGGYSNSADVNAATVGGGNQNTADGGDSTVSGGGDNYAEGAGATVGGGFRNEANGFYATVPGGFANYALGDYSFAAGFDSYAFHDGCFVWADSQGATFSSTGNDQFLIRAAGGVGIGTNAPAGQLHVASASGNPQVQITQNSAGNYARLRMNVIGSPSWEMDVSPGATPAISWWNSSLRMNLDYNGNLTTSGTVNGSSDRNVKEHFAPVSAREVLEKVSSLPITEWNYKTDGETLRHIGPMAQDFYAAFNVGTDDKHIGMVDADGVALAAIQGLNRKVEDRGQESESRIQKLEAENAELTQAVAELKQLVAQLAQTKPK